MHPAEPDFTGATWFKSSFSDSNGGSCVEVAVTGCWVGVRDSKQHGRGPVHAVSAAEWSAFLAGVRAGEFGARRPLTVLDGPRDRRERDVSCRSAAHVP